MTTKSKKTKHLGLKISEETARKLDEIVADESKKTPFAAVSSASVLIGLVHLEHEKRFGDGTAPVPKRRG